MPAALVVTVGIGSIVAGFLVWLWTVRLFSRIGRGTLAVTYFLRFEEPGLERRFGEQYRAYKRNVPRWVPRLDHWCPD